MAATRSPSVISSPAFVLLGWFRSTRSQLPGDLRLPVARSAVYARPWLSRASTVQVWVPSTHDVFAEKVTVVVWDGEAERPVTTTAPPVIELVPPATGSTETSWYPLGGVSVNLLSVRLSGVIAKDRLDACPGGSPVSGLRSVTTVGAAAAAGPAIGTSPTIAATTHERARTLNLRTFTDPPPGGRRSLPEARRTPDQNGHHPPFDLWRQRYRGLVRRDEATVSRPG